ncbi:MAG: septum formation initiator family protein [Acidiferrobacter sp.]
MRKWAGITIGVLLVLTQCALWFGRGGVVALVRREHDIHTLARRNTKLLKVDETLAADVQSLRNGTAAIEAHARSGLGMIRKGETFYEVIPGHPPAVRTASVISRYQQLAARG